jgi:ligand-binding sensor domain-containing protein
MIPIRFILIFLFVSFGHVENMLYGQEPYVKVLGIADGAPSTTIYDLYVAKNGLLFLGTDKGLYSYDGIDFFKYEFIESLAVGVNGILEDDKGVIWCKNFSNQIFYVSGNNLLLEQHTAKYLNKSETNLIDFKVNDNRIIIATERKILSISITGNIKVLYQITSRDDRESVTSIEYDPKSKNIYAGATHDLITLFPNGEFKTNHSTFGQNEILLFDGKPFVAFQGSKNEITNFNGSRFSKPTAPLGSLIKLSEANNKLWASTSKGVFSMDTDKKKNKQTTTVRSESHRYCW